MGTSAEKLGCTQRKKLGRTMPAVDTKPLRVADKFHSGSFAVKVRIAVVTSFIRGATKVPKVTAAISADHITTGAAVRPAHDQGEGGSATSAVLGCCVGKPLALVNDDVRLADGPATIGHVKLSSSEFLTKKIPSAHIYRKDAGRQTNSQENDETFQICL